MQLNSLQRNTRQQGPKRVGRGGKRGKTAGRGTKGQKARAGHRIRPEVRDRIKKIPKLRGYRFHGAGTKPAVVKLGDINKLFSAGATINPGALLEQKLVRRRGGVLPAVKILSGGTLTKNFQFIGCKVSATAHAQIEKAGGKIS